MASTEANPMHDLTAFQRDLLAATEKSDEQHGLGIKGYLDQYYEGEIHHGRFYPNMNRLVEMGMVEKGTIDERTNEYTLTPRAKREMAAHVRWLQGDAGQA